MVVSCFFDINHANKNPTKNQNIPDVPCMDYLPTLGEKWLHSKGDVGKYPLHGAFGYDLFEVSFPST